MSESPRPEMVIAIDFGMTCTGVAYCNIGAGEVVPRVIQKWPGNSKVENKVPTVLVYPKNSTTPTSWGFLTEHPSEQSREDKQCKEWFKTYLDEERLHRALSDPSNQGICPASSIQEVERLYCDFFRYIYQTIQTKLQGELRNQWENACIEFIFSVPTTWKTVPTVERFRSIIKRAGFGAYPNHRADIGLTEAEAAAVHTALKFPLLFKEGEVLLVCDVGGGTTDLNALRVTNVGVQRTVSMEQMDVVQGATIGSVQLDTAFETSVRQRLDLANQMIPIGYQPNELDDIAWKMMKCKEYQNAKCDYGSVENDTPNFTVSVPGLRPDYINTNWGIQNGEMWFKRDEVKSYFDAQIAKIYELLDRQLTRLQQKFPQEQVSHLILSGGLGNSAYVEARLRDRYALGRSPFPNAQSLMVKVAPDPQLVVCVGTVANRVHELNEKVSIIKWRCCRASYGTIAKVPYNSQNPEHFGRRPVKDNFDGKLYILECISWFIKEGQPVSTDNPILKNFIRKCPPASPLHVEAPRIFKTDIITCDLDQDMLPLVMNSSCRKICDVSSDLSSVPLAMFKLKNRHWWNWKPRYHRIEYVIKVALGAADIRFELWHNGQKLSKDNPITVQWFSADAPPEVNPQNKFNGWNGPAVQVTTY